MSVFARASVAWSVAAILLVAAVALNAVLWIDRDALLGRVDTSNRRLDGAYRRIEDLQAEVQGLRAENETLAGETEQLTGEVADCVDALRASVRLYNGVVGELNAIGALDPAQAEAFEAEVEALRAQANDALRECERVTA